MMPSNRPAKKVFSVAMISMAIGLGQFVSQTAHAVEIVTTAAVELAELGDDTRVSGTVIPLREVTLAAQLPGEIKYLAGKEGDRFKIGTVIVAVDDENIRAERRAAVASFLAAQSVLYNAQIQYNRELWSPKTGKSSGMGFPQMMDDMMGGFQGQRAGTSRPWVDRHANIQSQAQGVQGARSRFMAARARIDIIDARLRDAQLKVPFNGKILSKMVEIGDTVQPGQPLIRFGFTDILRIKAEVPVRLVSSLKRGMVVDAYLDVTGDQRIQAWVSQIFPLADPNSHTVTVKFDLPKTIRDKSGKIVPLLGGPGMYAEVSISDIHKKSSLVPTVPESAIVTRGSMKAVIVRQKNGRSSLRMVRLGDRVEGDRRAVLSGLRGDEQVITGPPEKLSSMQSGVSTKSSNGK